MALLIIVAGLKVKIFGLNALYSGRWLMANPALMVRIIFLDDLEILV